MVQNARLRGRINDIDLEMMTHCGRARLIPISKEMDADLLSCATTLLSAFDWRRQPALRNIGFFSSNALVMCSVGDGAYMGMMASFSHLWSS
jgi:hypothetical protein